MILSTFAVISTLIVVQTARAVKGVPRVCNGAVKHLHLAVGQDPSREMTISFASTWSDINSDNNVDKPVGGVFVGLTPDNLDRFVPQQESPFRYHVLMEHKKKANTTYCSPFQHHITIDDLSPNTKYYYVATVGKSDEQIEYMVAVEQIYSRTRQDERDSLLGRDSNSGVNETIRRNLTPSPYEGTSMPCLDTMKVRSFKTAPQQDRDVVKFAVVGDLGQFQHSIQTLEHMANNQNDINAVVLVGDISYANGHHENWDTFFDFLDDSNIFQHIPLQVATGNHDIEKQEHGSDIFQSYEARFRMPRAKLAKIEAFDIPGKINLDAPPYPLPYNWGNAFYSFAYGPAMHIVLSAYSSMEQDSEQYRWLQEQLDGVDRQATPWLLVSLHTPLYSSFAVHEHDPQILAAQEHLEPLFVKHQVNIVFAGHIHAYQRTANVVMGRVDQGGPIYITVGAGGRQCDAPFKSLDVEDWLLARDASLYGYGLLSVLNRTHAEWSWIPLSASDKHEYNYVKGDKDTKLPPLTNDYAMISNQFFVP